MCHIFGINICITVMVSVPRSIPKVGVFLRPSKLFQITPSQLPSFPLVGSQLATIYRWRHQLNANEDQTANHYRFHGKPSYKEEHQPCICSPAFAALHLLQLGLLMDLMSS